MTLAVYIGNTGNSVLACVSVGLRGDGSSDMVMRALVVVALAAAFAVDELYSSAVGTNTATAAANWSH